jgi:DNA-binding PadR family transcriptional regulator
MMLITSDLIRGHTETIILAQLMHRDSYGYEINKAIHKKTDGRYELKEATLYSAFRRLEGAQLIRSYWGDEATGARRRYYTITELGRNTYQQNRADWEKAKAVIDQLIATKYESRERNEV